MDAASSKTSLSTPTSPVAEGTNETAELSKAPSPKLNPYAKEWNPSIERTSLPTPTSLVAEGTSQTAEVSKAPSTKLNPSAKEWNFSIERASEEDRCLFLTFSNGYPLTENQIIRFFNNKFGPCVERVYVHWPVPRYTNSPPLFGKVVFKMSYIPIGILNGHKQTKFMIDGKPLWCKKFEAKKKQENQHGSAN